MSTAIHADLDQLKYAIEFETGIEDLFKKSRRRDYTDARCLFYKFGHEHLGNGWTKLGRYTNQNHATVMHSVKKFDGLYMYDRNFKNRWDSLLESNSIKKTSLNKYNRYKRLDNIFENNNFSEEQIDTVFANVIRQLRDNINE